MQYVADTTASGLLEPSQSLTEKRYSKISHSRQFTSPWWQHWYSSWDVRV